MKQAPGRSPWGTPVTERDLRSTVFNKQARAFPERVLRPSHFSCLLRHYVFTLQPATERYFASPSLREQYLLSFIYSYLEQSLREQYSAFVHLIPLGANFTRAILCFRPQPARHRRSIGTRSSLLHQLVLKQPEPSPETRATSAGTRSYNSRHPRHHVRIVN